MNKYDVIVVGAGISGLLAALTLSKHGKRVLVLEKTGQVGGNCNSYMVDDYQVDTGAHAITHLAVGPLKRLMDNYFDFVPVFENFGNYFIRTEDSFQKVPSNLRELITYDIVPKKDRLVLSQAATKALTLSIFGIDLSKQSVYDSLPRTLSKDTYELVNAISYFLSGKSMKETSIHRMLTGSSFIRDSVTQEHFESVVGPKEMPQHTESILQSVLRSNLHTSLGLKLSGILESSFQIKSTIPNPLASIGRFAVNSDTAQAQGYPRKGLKSLLNAVLYSLPETVEMQTQCEVKRILTNEGGVIGVEADQAYYADLVVYTGFAKNLPDIVEDLPRSYVNYLGGIDQTKSLTVWLGLDRKMDEFKYMGSEIWFKDTPYWAMPISNFDSSLAPKGKQLVGFVFVMDENKSEDSVIKKAYDTVYRAVPSIERHVEMQHEQITIPEKAAVTINGKIADIRTPIKNLYLAGTDTDSRSMGITRAAYSIIEMLGALNEDRNLH
ncbi:MAG: NAD(P)/FAD-dependent oxidoreductase [ANME-2 cluster archaeon]|jgi:all-trans-retinol 13,14-reductase|nr:NAD(P)/FAD-dependent oxidoreductase [ANME-2 cluster archaeon]